MVSKNNLCSYSLKGYMDSYELWDFLQGIV